MPARENEWSSKGLNEAQTAFVAAPKEPNDQEDQSGKRPNIERGVEVLKTELRTISNEPGVYRMLDNQGDPIYVGKAKNLKKRVTNYTLVNKLPYRLQRMVSETRALEIVTTHTEVEALLLESNLIKRFMPRYNVLLRDDKSFPYIHISYEHDYPEIKKHRGAQKKKGDYYGPFASAGAVNRTLATLEKAFLLRSCSDSVFAQRTRPCLQYQIKRCSAPCVEKISRESYRVLVDEAKAFLTGENSKIQAQFAQSMQKAAAEMDYETAAAYRDRIRALTAVQSRQDINLEGTIGDADVIAGHKAGGQTCIQVFFFRAGRNYGNRAYYPSHDKNDDLPYILSAFIGQFYDDKPIPPLLLLSDAIEGQDLVQEALSVKADRKIELRAPQRGDKRKLVDHALNNAKDALGRKQAESSAQAKLLVKVGEVMGMSKRPNRIEVYDNSHIQGTDAYGAMIVAGPEGFIKQAYRKFKIQGSARAGAENFEPGDDYAMMREVLHRRLSRAMKEDPERNSESWPDLLLIDGGKGQLSSVVSVVKDLGLTENVTVCAIAKGPDRNAGREEFFMEGRPSFSLESNDPALYFLQRLRDEAHRFVIGSHRTGRQKKYQRSALDEIQGIGASRKKALLLHFGSARAVERAGLTDLEAADGISKSVAQKIYNHFHSDLA